MKHANLVRTDSTNANFISLVRELDKDLAIRDGDEHSFYNQFNKIANLNHVVVAYVGSTSVGCGAIKPFDDTSMEVKRMFVAESHRGQGIARQILTALESWAAELGYHRCVLETGKRQPEAIHLYKKCGYEIIPNYGQYQGMENSVCFSRELSTAK